MKFRFTLIITISLLLFSGSIQAGLSTDPIVFRSGAWSVHKSVDAMTDKVSCTGIYKKQYGIQLTDNALYLNVRGGVRGVTLRFGNQKAQGQRLATEMEKSIGSVIIKDGEFKKVLGSDRLRSQVLTYLDTLDNKDINLTGAPVVVQFIRSGCSEKTVQQHKPKTTAANTKKSVSHSHNGRTHSHPLPAQGVKHRHGNGAVGK